MNELNYWKERLGDLLTTEGYEFIEFVKVDGFSDTHFCRVICENCFKEKIVTTSDILEGTIKECECFVDKKPMKKSISKEEKISILNERNEINLEYLVTDIVDSLNILVVHIDCGRERKVNKQRFFDSVLKECECIKERKQEELRLEEEKQKIRKEILKRDALKRIELEKINTNLAKKMSLIDFMSGGEEGNNNKDNSYFNKPANYYKYRPKRKNTNPNTVKKLESVTSNGIVKKTKKGRTSFIIEPLILGPVVPEKKQKPKENIEIIGMAITENTKEIVFITESTYTIKGKEVKPAKIKYRTNLNKSGSEIPKSRIMFQVLAKDVSNELEFRSGFYGFTLVELNLNNFVARLENEKGEELYVYFSEYLKYPEYVTKREYAMNYRREIVDVEYDKYHNTRRNEISNAFELIKFTKSKYKRHQCKVTSQCSKCGSTESTTIDESDLKYFKPEICTCSFEEDYTEYIVSVDIDFESLRDYVMNKKGYNL